MKKLLVLSLVMSIASLATAGLALNPTDDAPLSGVMAINFVKDAGNLEGYDLTLRVASGTAEFSGAVLSTVGGWMAAPVIHSSGNGWLRITAGAFPAFGFNGLTTDDVILSVNYTGAMGTVVELYNTASTIGGADVAAGVLDSVTLIPEPMTIGILGLGALFLRRRK